MCGESTPEMRRAEQHDVNDRASRARRSTEKHMLGGVCRRYNGLEHHQSSAIGNFFISLIGN